MTDGRANAPRQLAWLLGCPARPSQTPGAPLSTPGHPRLSTYGYAPGPRLLACRLGLGAPALGVLWGPLGGRSPHFPAYNTVRDLFLALDADDVDRQVRPWLERLLNHPLGGLSADGKVLRGSKRDDLPALHVVSLVTHDCASILAQRQAPGGDEVAALLALLTEVPLTHRTIRWMRIC